MDFSPKTIWSILKFWSILVFYVDYYILNA